MIRTGRFARMRGITLMELMVVMAVIGILSAIAIPSYRAYMIRVNRTDAKRDLMAFSQRLERCFTRTNNYTDAACTVNFGAGIVNAEGTYSVTAVMDANTYTLTATPVNGQAEDARCAAFTLNQAGVQGVTGTSPALDCWQGQGT